MYFFLQVIRLLPGQPDFGELVVGNTLMYLSTMLVPNTEYTFRVAAVNGFGDGVYSPDMIVRTNFDGALL
jgi:hypothetical protein